MTVDEILAELPNLQPHEWEAVSSKACELIREELFKDIGQPKSQSAAESCSAESDGWIGSIDSLPEDFAANHDHYIWGTPKRR